MPKNITIEVSPTGLKKGDHHVDLGADIVSVVPKRTRATVLLSTGREVTMDLTSQQVIVRTVATEDEQAAEKHAFQLDYLGRQLRAAFRHVDQAVAKVNEHHANGYRLDGFDLDNIAAASAQLEPWATVAHILANGDGTDIIEAHAHVVEREREALINDQYRGSSSSVAHNAFEHARRAAASSFVRGF